MSRKREPGKRSSAWIKRGDRIDIYKSFNLCCAYCGEDLGTLFTWKQRTLDHVVPRALGGTDSRQNVVLCCKRCNDRKQDMPADEFTWRVKRELSQLQLPLVYGVNKPARRAPMRKINKDELSKVVLVALQEMDGCCMDNEDERAYVADRLSDKIMEFLEQKKAKAAKASSTASFA